LTAEARKARVQSRATGEGLGEVHRRDAEHAERDWGATDRCWTMPLFKVVWPWYMRDIGRAMATTTGLMGAM
jgi:hypothetical protein